MSLARAMLCTKEAKPTVLNPMVPLSVSEFLKSVSWLRLQRLIVYVRPQSLLCATLFLSQGCPTFNKY